MRALNRGVFIEPAGKNDQGHSLRKGSSKITDGKVELPAVRKPFKDAPASPFFTDDRKDVTPPKLGDYSPPRLKNLRVVKETNLSPSPILKNRMLETIVANQKRTMIRNTEAKPIEASTIVLDSPIKAGGFFKLARPAAEMQYHTGVLAKVNTKPGDITISYITKETTKADTTITPSIEHASESKAPGVLIDQLYASLFGFKAKDSPEIRPKRRSSQSPMGNDRLPTIGKENVRTNERLAVHVPPRASSVISSALVSTRSSTDSNLLVLEHCLDQSPDALHEDIPPTYSIRYAMRSRAGSSPSKPKKVNQDSYILCPNFTQSNVRHFFAVNDGHGKNGHLVSNFIKERLPANLESRGKLEMNTRGSLISAYQLTDSGLRDSNIDIQLSGSTSISVLFLRDKMFCGNVGDSRAILLRNTKGGWSCVPLSYDHKPDSEAEAKRIRRKGGRIEPLRTEDGSFAGPHRVWLKNEDIPGLAMTRSIGDLVAASIGVTWMPEIVEHSVTPFDKIVILASDGLWEFYPNQDVMHSIIPFYEKNDIEGAADELLRTAQARWQEVPSVLNKIRN